LNLYDPRFLGHIEFFQRSLSVVYEIYYKNGHIFAQNRYLLGRLVKKTAHKSDFMYRIMALASNFSEKS
jgi:hypothetical protein